MAGDDMAKDSASPRSEAQDGSRGGERAGSRKGEPDGSQGGEWGGSSDGERVGSHSQDGPGVGPWRGWRAAAERALYGPNGFYRRPEGPAGHFRTSVHASPLYAQAIAALLARVDAALGRPAELAIVDVGAGRGELLTGVLSALGDDADGIGKRLRPYAVERAARPAGLDPRIDWLDDLPAPGSLTGLLIANEWLDNVPVDVAEVDADGVPRQVLVSANGTERLGDPLAGEDAAWLADWWPLDAEPGLRAEPGPPRDAAWARAVCTLDTGLAVAIDYAHARGSRPPYGTLTGFRNGREVRPVPDGTCDLTTHVALDACAAAGARAATDRRTAPPHRLRTTPTDHGPEVTDDHGPGTATDQGPGATPRIRTQRDALRALGVTGRRPPLALASTDPAGYVRALSAAGDAAELTDPAGLGGFLWLCQPVGPAALADVLA